jgi:hypothetical protein
MNNDFVLLKERFLCVPILKMDIRFIKTDVHFLLLKERGNYSIGLKSFF